MTRVEMFLQRLEAVLKEKGISRYRLAQMMGVEEATLYKLFHRETYPELETIDKICKLLDIGLGDFFSYDTRVDYGIEILPGDIEMLESFHELDFNEKSNLNGEMKYEDLADDMKLSCDALRARIYRFRTTLKQKALFHMEDEAMCA